MRIGPAADVGRLTIPEVVTALWTFANASGFKTDDIVERTGAEGVTVDGLLIKDSGIPEAAVTAHEAALTIGTGSIAAVAEAVVTAHEAALTILESQITDGSILARLAAAEAITGLYAFSHASGIQIDDISERTGAAGVTIDGLLLKDNKVDSLGHATDAGEVMRTNVNGDSVRRFELLASGKQSWGPGNAALDAIFYRAALGVLKTDTALHVAGTLTALGQLYWSYDSKGLGAGRNDDFDPGAKAVVRISAGGGGRTIAGFSGGVDGRVLVVINVDTDAFTLEDQEASSVAANRFALAGSSDEIIGSEGACHLWYDGTSGRWRNTSIQD